MLPVQRTEQSSERQWLTTAMPGELGLLYLIGKKQYAGLRKLVDTINKKEDLKVCPFQGKGGGE